MDEGSAQSKSRKMQERTLKDAITHAAEIKMTQSSPEEEPVVGCGPGAEDSPTLMPEQALSQKIRVAHAYVEHCLVRYMTKDETVQKVSEFFTLSDLYRHGGESVDILRGRQPFLL